jgi:cell division protein FtsA
MESVAMSERLIAGIDIGTTKVCVLVGERDRHGTLNILGSGLCPSRGLRRGMVIDIGETVEAITLALDRAERLSGRQILSAYVGIAGNHIESQNTQGVVAVSPNSHEIDRTDVSRALDAARAIEIATSREVIHVIPRGYTIDGQRGIKDPLGMLGYRLEVECHIITGAIASIQNVIKCVQRASVEIDDLVLEPLASSEAVLSPTERELGAIVLDIGGGTSDLAIFLEGAVAHSIVLPLGGDLITSDIAFGLRIPFLAAEELKLASGHANPSQVDPEQVIDLEPYVPDCPEVVKQHTLAQIIEARVEELFEKIQAEIQQAGYDSLLPSGIVLTGGTAELPGIAEKARAVFHAPVRIGGPRGLHGVADNLSAPTFSTAVGLLLWGMQQHEAQVAEAALGANGDSPKGLKRWLRRLLP